jgi:Predicted glycosyltransferases
MKSLSIIIVTYNSQDLIEKCLSHLFLHNDIGDELQVIIVDNSNVNVSKEMFDFVETKFPERILLIKNDKNGGYGQGNNLGISHAEGKYIAIMNPDITMTEPLFKNVLEKFENNNKLGMLAYKQYGGFDLSFYIRQEFTFPLITHF